MASTGLGREGRSYHLTSIEQGGTIMRGVMAFITVLLIMPLGHALTVMALKLPPDGQQGVILAVVVVAVLLIYITKYMQSPAWETFVGMIAGVLLWVGLVEIGVKRGAEALGIEETKAMEFSLVIIVPLVLYFLFNENIRCNFFVFWRRTLKLLKGEMRDVLIDHWGPRMAFKMFAMVWMGHVALFFAYDEDFFGVQSVFCKFFFLVCLVAGIYLFYQLLSKAKEMDYAFRYAMPTVIVVWSCIETLVKWKVFSEPWITLNPLFLAIVSLIFLITLITIVQGERRRRRNHH